jgi:hypothetical protein
MTVDVSRGMKMDYSAFVIVDISSYPHRVVGKYRNNNIKPMLYPDIIVQVAKQYNNAWVLCEVNDIGDQVASIIFYDMEYENLLMTSMRGRAGQVLGHGFSGGKTQLGLKMAASPKKIGTSNLKQMVESDKVLISDFNIINELTTFIERRNSFAAEDGCHDDMVMCMVIYAWAVAQDYFKEMTDQSIRKELYEKDKDSLEEDMAPFGFIDDGGGIVGPFAKGPVDELVLIETEAELQKTFGDPTTENAEYWYTVANFLEYGGVCFVVRCNDLTAQTMKNAADTGTAPYIKNQTDFDENYYLSAGSTSHFVSRNPGVWGNAIGVSVIDAGADWIYNLATTGKLNLSTGQAAADTVTFSTSVAPGQQTSVYNQVKAAAFAEPTPLGSSSTEIHIQRRCTYWRS